MSWAAARLRDGTRIGALFASVLSVLLLVVGLGSLKTAAAPTERVDILVSFARQPGPAERALVQGLGGVVKGAYRIVPAIAASIPEAALAALQANPNVVRVEIDGQVEAFHLADPDTPEVASAWGVDRLDANLLWNTTTDSGRGVGIAIVDTGTGPHPDLPGAVARLNCLSGTCLPGGDDDHGHGTHVGGIALALENGIGVVGVAPAATLFSYKVLNKFGSGSWSGIVAALDHIVNYNLGSGTPQIRIANFSLGSSFDPGSIVKAAFDNAYAAGVLLIAAAGNSGNPAGRGDKIAYPARFASVVAVGATDDRDRRASFSSTGPDLELVAPGVDVLSAVLNGGYGIASGTSMAAPHVSGAAALVVGAWIVGGVVDAIDTNGVNGIADEARALLDSTAKDLGKMEGPDSQYGNGLVNPERAVTGRNTHF